MCICCSPKSSRRFQQDPQRTSSSIWRTFKKDSLGSGASAGLLFQGSALRGLLPLLLGLARQVALIGDLLQRLSAIALCIVHPNLGLCSAVKTGMDFLQLLL